MSSDRAVQALRQSRATDSQRKRDLVLAAIADLSDAQIPVTVSAVATQAEVSRQFIYSSQDLRNAIDKAAASGTAPASSKPRKGRDALTDGLQADRSALAQHVERLRVRNSELEAAVATLQQQRARWLGAQLEQDSTIDPEVHSELRITNERLMTDNIALRRQSLEQQRQIDILRDELSASRTAHREDLAALTDGDGTILVMPNNT